MAAAVTSPLAPVISSSSVDDASALTSAPRTPNSFKMKTRIICTIGPKSNSVDMLCKLLDAGMCIVRMNTAHGDFDYHQSIIDNTRAACRIKKTTCALLLDIKGPEIRTGKLKPNPARDDKKEWLLEKGTTITITTDLTQLGSNTLLATTYRNLPRICKPGTKVLCADGLIAFTVISTTDDTLQVKVENSGYVGENKNMNVPGESIDLPAVTEKDKKFIEFGVRNEIDFIAASFIRKAADVIEVRNLPGVLEKGMQIVSKIESQEGIDNFDSILEVTDAIMVARGDLGVEIPVEKIPGAQKTMIEKCNKAGIPVVTATQMLESMVVNPRPSRAEITDVFNAVIDGTDCVMLSGETANGSYPVECVATMANICRSAEATIDYRSLFIKMRASCKPPIPIAESVASSAVKTSWDMGAGVIVAITETGKTARLISKYRPHCPIIAVTANPLTARQIMIVRGGYPYLVSSLDQSSDRIISSAAKKALRGGFVTENDYLTVITGMLDSKSEFTNLMKVLRVSEVLPQYGY